MIARLCAASAASAALHGAALAALATLAALPNGLDPRPLRLGSELTVSLREPAPPGGTRPDVRRTASRPGRHAAAGSPALPVPVYHPPGELDERPLVRVHVEPQFPAGAAVGEGRVRLNLYIGEDGKVERLEITEATPSGVFEEPTIAAFSGALFTPGKIKGVAVRSRLDVEVLYGAPAPVTQNAATFGAPR